MATGTGGIVGIFTVEIPPALQIGHAHRSRGEKHTQAPADHRSPGIGSNCPEIIHLFQVGDGDGGGKSTCCLVGGNRDLVVPGGGGGDCTSPILISPADLHRGVLPARAIEDAGEHRRLPRRLGDTHRPEPCGTILWASEIEWVMNRGQIKVQYFSMILTSIIWEEVWQIQYVCLILSTYLNFNTCKNTKNIKKVKLF